MPKLQQFADQWKGRIKVLIVDDSPVMRRLIRRVALSPAEDCFECVDGTEALAAYERNQLGGDDWVLMDLKMAKMDGLVATRQLRASHPEARIVIVTDYDDDQLRAAAFQNGAYDFVPKENLLALRALLNSAA